MKKLDNKNALVLGGAEGIGLAIATHFASQGATTWFTSRSEQDLQSASEIIGNNGRPLCAEVSQPQVLNELMSNLAREITQLDVLVINAGMSNYAPTGEITAELFDNHFNLNVRAPVFALQAALPLLKPGASVILIGSIAGNKSAPGYAVYGATKAALHSFARTWAAELTASKKIRVNVIAPGPVDTEMMAAASEAIRSNLSSRIPMGRMAKPAEIADAALFLASEESSYISGAEITLDGGMSKTF